MHKVGSPRSKKYAILVLVLLVSIPWILIGLEQSDNIKKLVLRIEQQEPL